MALAQAASVIRWDDPAKAEGMVRCAAELAPNDADILAYLSFRSAHFPALAPDAVRWSDKAAALNPYAPDWYHWNRGAAMMVVGRFAEAAEAYARARTTSYRVPAKSPRSRSRARWRRPAPGWRTCYAMRLLSPPRGMPKLRAFIPTLPPSMHAALTGRGWRSTEIQRNLAAARRSAFPKAGARCEGRIGRPFRRRRRGWDSEPRNEGQIPRRPGHVTGHPSRRRRMARRLSGNVSLFFRQC